MVQKRVSKYYDEQILPFLHKEEKINETENENENENEKLNKLRNDILQNQQNILVGGGEEEDRGRGGEGKTGGGSFLVRM